MKRSDKTVAEQAYCDLLVMARPQTDRDFRRAVVMAVLIGRQIESGFLAGPSLSEQQQTTPTKQANTKTT